MIVVLIAVDGQRIGSLIGMFLWDASHNVSMGDIRSCVLKLIGFYRCDLGGKFTLLPSALDRHDASFLRGPIVNGVAI